MLNIALAGVEYAVGKKLKLRSSMINRHVSNRIRQGGVISTKLCQIAASRSDIFSDTDLRDELRKLQSSQVSDVEFSASIAVVTIDRKANTATKRVKSEKVLDEVLVIERLYRWARWIFPESAQIDMLGDVVNTVCQEVDMASEKRKNEMIRNVWSEFEEIVVPLTYKACDEYVVMEYVESTLVKDITEPVELELVNSFFRDVSKSLITTGIAHMDLHTGNVGLSLDGEHIVVYDMGSIVEIRTSAVDRMLNSSLECAESLFFEDWDSLAQQVLESGLIVSIDDPMNLKLVVQTSIRYMDGDAGSRDMYECFRKVKGDATLTADFIQVIQCLTLLESTCKEMNKEFKIRGAIGV